MSVHNLWQSTDASCRPGGANRQRVAEEAADIFIFLTYLCHTFDIDLLRAVERKMALNGKKYPVTKARGSSRKYTEL